MYELGRSRIQKGRPIILPLFFSKKTLSATEGGEWGPEKGERGTGTD